MTPPRRPQDLSLSELVELVVLILLRPFSGEVGVEDDGWSLRMVGLAIWLECRLGYLQTLLREERLV